MTTLPNFPHGDQRTEATKDGRPPENGNYDCVAESLAKAIQYYVGTYVSGDELKDAEYGEAYANAGTALVRYIDDVADRARTVYHVSAAAFSSTDPAALVRQIHAWVDAGYPVIATIPSAWNSTAAALGVSNRATQSQNISSHVVVFFATGSGTLTAMNPWGGFDQVESDQWWADRLLFCQVWRVYKEGQNSVTLNIGDLGGYGFHEVDATHWTCDGKVVGNAILAAFRALPFGQTGKPITAEFNPVAGKRVALQVFERCALCWDPDKAVDNPPSWVTSDVYAAHIDAGAVRDFFEAALRSQVDGLKVQVASAASQVADLQAKLDAAQAQAQAAGQVSDALRAALLKVRAGLQADVDLAAAIDQAVK